MHRSQNTSSLPLLLKGYTDEMCEEMLLTYFKFCRPAVAKKRTRDILKARIIFPFVAIKSI